MSLKLIQTLNSIYIAERIPSNEHVEAVISIPPGLSPQNKSLLYASCNLAGLEVTQFIETTTGPAQLYALERSHKFKNSTRTVAFADIGSSGSRISIFKFINDQNTNQTEVLQLSSTFNNHIGGNLIDERLAILLAQRYNISLENPKQKALFLSDIRSVKEMLTIHPSVDLKFDDEDFDDVKIVTATREDLINISQEFNQTIFELVKNSMKQAKINKIDSLELIGGGTRVHFIQNVLKEAFKVTKASRSLDGDHAVAMGAGYIAAELSKEFKVIPVKRSTLLSSASTFSFKDSKNTIKRFNVFTMEDFDDISSEVQVISIPDQVFTITGANGHDYMKFTIVNLTKETNLNISLIHNYYLMPVPYEIIDENGNSYDFEMKNVGWELTQETLPQMNERIKYLISVLNKRRKLEKIANDFEALVYQMKHFVEANSVDQIHDNDNNNQKELDDLKKMIEKGMELVENHGKQEEYEKYFHEFKEKFDEIQNLDKFAKGKAYLKLEKSIKKAYLILENKKYYPEIFENDEDFLELENEINNVVEWLKEHPEKDNNVKANDYIDKRATLKEKMINVNKKLRALKKNDQQDKAESFLLK